LIRDLEWDEIHGSIERDSEFSGHRLDMDRVNIEKEVNRCLIRLLRKEMEISGARLPYYLTRGGMIAMMWRDIPEVDRLNVKSLAMSGNGSGEPLSLGANPDDSGSAFLFISTDSNRCALPSALCRCRDSAWIEALKRLTRIVNHISWHSAK
jgi:hypothetical protein